MIHESKVVVCVCVHPRHPPSLPRLAPRQPVGQVWAKIMSLDLAGNMGAESARWMLMTRMNLTRARVDQLMPPYDFKRFPTVLSATDIQGGGVGPSNWPPSHSSRRAAADEEDPEGEAALARKQGEWLERARQREQREVAAATPNAAHKALPSESVGAGILGADLGELMKSLFPQLARCAGSGGKQGEAEGEQALFQQRDTTYTSDGGMRRGARGWRMGASNNWVVHGNRTATGALRSGVGVHALQASHLTNVASVTFRQAPAVQ